MKHELLKKIQGKQTLDTIAEKLNLTKNSAANLVSKLRKEGYLKSSGGGKQPRIYTISLKKNSSLENGMFDILATKTPVKVVPPFTHKVKGKYKIEDAIVDLIKLNDIRILSGVVYLFNYVTDWAYLRRKASGIEARLGALYDFASKVRKTRKMPANIRSALNRKKPKKIDYWILKNHPSEMELKWNTTIPLKGEDY